MKRPVGKVTQVRLETRPLDKSEWHVWYSKKQEGIRKRTFSFTHRGDRAVAAKGTCSYILRDGRVVAATEVSRSYDPNPNFDDMVYLGIGELTAGESAAPIAKKADALRRMVRREWHARLGLKASVAGTSAFRRWRRFQNESGQ